VHVQKYSLPSLQHKKGLSMKTFIISIALIFLSSISLCQDIENPKIGLKDFEKGLNNLDYFRVLLIEQGFKLDNNNTSDNLESWQITYWFNPLEKYFPSIYLQIRYNAISIDIDKDYFPVLANALLDEVKIKYPDKTVEKEKYVNR